MAEIARHPRSEYVADLVGLNFFRGTARDGVVALDGGGEIVVADHAVAGAVYVAFHPRAVVALACATPTAACGTAGPVP